MKVSFVLTFCSLLAGVLAGSGCAHPAGTPNLPPKAPAPASVAQPHEIPPLPTTETIFISNPPAVPAQPKESDADSFAVQEPPPRPQIEVLGKPPTRDVTWLPGHWEWDGSWVWKGGRWIALPEPNAAWIPGRWSRRDEGWVWVEGYWRMTASR